MAKSGRAWKLERASVSIKGKSRPRSNKYSNSDSSRKPAPGTRKKFWVGGHMLNGSYVKGHYRRNPHYRGK